MLSLLLNDSTDCFALPQSYTTFAYRSAIALLLCSYCGVSQGHKTTYVQAHVVYDFWTLESLKNALDRNLLSAKDEYNNLSAVPPCIHGPTMLLSGYQHIHGNSRMPSRCRILCDSSHLTAPSAVHLTTCFLPDSQHHRFSV